MFRPSPTLVEIGTEEDTQQFNNETNKSEDDSFHFQASPIATKAKPIFETPDQTFNRHRFDISTPVSRANIDFDSPSS